MEFWQYPLAFIFAILIALFLSISLAYLNIRFIRQDDQAPFFPLLYLLFRSNPKVIPANSSVLSSLQTVQESVVKTSTQKKHRELVDLMTPELADEFEHNRISAALFTGNHMSPLQTEAWDALQDSTHKLPAYLRVELDYFYADIKKLNNLVWLSAKLDSQDSSLADYRKLLDRIVQRANKTKSLVTAGFPE